VQLKVLIYEVTFSCYEDKLEFNLKQFCKLKLYHNIVVCFFALLLVTIIFALNVLHWDRIVQSVVNHPESGDKGRGNPAEMAICFLDFWALSL